jgi:hypothetical protein
MPLLERSKKKFVTDIVATLGLGLLPRQGFARLRAKKIFQWYVARHLHAKEIGAIIDF